MFNDCWAMFFMYAAILALLNRRLSLATLLYSYALCPPPPTPNT